MKVCKVNMQGIIKDCMDMSYTIPLTKEEDNYAFLMLQENN